MGWGKKKNSSQSLGGTKITKHPRWVWSEKNFHHTDSKVKQAGKMGVSNS